MNSEDLRVFASVKPFEYSADRGASETIGWRKEHMSWKKTCYVGDWSFVPQVRFTGPDVTRLFSDLSTNSFTTFANGAAKHCIQCDERGKVVAEGVLLRYSEDDFEYESGTPMWACYHAAKGGYDVDFEFRFTHKLQISGPTALALCEELAGESLTDIKFMHFKNLDVSGMSVLFLRQGMAGEPGFELHGPIEQRAALYARILEVGAKHGVVELGRRGFMINHLEACFPTGGTHFFNAVHDERHSDYRDWVDAHLPEEWAGLPQAGALRYSRSSAIRGSFVATDITEYYRSPYEMGWGRQVKFDHDFIGREALEKESSAPARRVVTLEFNSEDVVEIYASMFNTDAEPFAYLEIPHQPYANNWVDQVQKDGKSVGHATFPGYSYYFRRVLALSFIDVEFAEPGTEVEILWGEPGERQRLIRATVHPAPYKADKRRDALVGTAAPVTV